MGHSFGGTLTQLLLARGLGAAGVVVDSAPTEGVRVNPPSQVKSLFPALKNPPTGTRPSVHAGGIPLRLHQHAERGGIQSRLGPLPHRRPGQLGLGVRAVRQLQARPPGDLGRLHQGPGAAAVHRRREGPHHAAVGEQVERQALQDHRRSPTTTSSKAATTGPAPRPGGKQSPTTHWSGPSCTRRLDAGRPRTADGRRPAVQPP